MICKFCCDAVDRDDPYGHIACDDLVAHSVEKDGTFVFTARDRDYRSCDCQHGNGGEPLRRPVQGKPEPVKKKVKAKTKGRATATTQRLANVTQGADE